MFQCVPINDKTIKTRNKIKGRRLVDAPKRRITILRMFQKPTPAKRTHVVRCVNSNYVRSLSFSHEVFLIPR